jgi:hypothetical protein
MFVEIKASQHRIPVVKNRRYLDLTVAYFDEPGKQQGKENEGIDEFHKLIAKGFPKNSKFILENNGNNWFSWHNCR